MKNIFNILVLALLFSGVSACTSPATAQQERTVVKEQLQNGAILVDVRTPAEFAAGSVSGAINIPLGEISSRISEFQNKPGVVVFCRSGNRSSQAKEILEKNGIQNVTNGINADNVKAEMK